MSTSPRVLLLVRHSKADRPDDVPDHDRPLTGRGRRDAAAVGRWLAEQRLVPDLVLCSDATRAAQTWDHAAAALGRDVAVRPTEELYDASAEAVVNLCAQAPVDVRVLAVVGHEPTMSTVAAALAGPGSDEALLAQVRAHLPTSGVVVLELDGDWDDLAGGTCRLTGLAAPRG